MEDIKPQKPKHVSPQAPERRLIISHRPGAHAAAAHPYAANQAAASHRAVGRPSITLALQVPRLIARPLKMLWNTDVNLRFAFALTIFTVLLSQIIPLVQPALLQHAYALEGAEAVLPAASPAMEKYLTLDEKNAVYTFNAGYAPGPDGAVQTGGPQITAMAYQDPAKGISVTDPANSLDVGLKPKFSLLPGKQQQNRVVYPLANGSGWLVYTMTGVGVKEDVLLSHADGNTLAFDYDLTLGDGLEARLEKSGGIGIYGSSLPINGNVTTGSQKDAELLQQARKKAPKNQLLFAIPTPVVHEHNQTTSHVQARYELTGGTHLQLKVGGLAKAQYPLSIDPSVYVESAAKFMQGNNESNIDFDVDDSLIQKGTLTGARFESWTSTTALNVARWNGATVVAGGYIYLIGGSGSGSSTNFGTVYWAKLNTSSWTIDSPTAGVTTCTNWCTSTTYDLPSSQLRRGLSAVAYNGYLYAIGGKDAGCVGTNNVCSTVYKTKLGASGEPVSWSATSSLGTARSYFGAIAYNNRIYAVGGQSNTTLNGEQSVEFANINPDGTLSAWSTTGMTSIPTAGRWGHTLLQYNGYMYLVGGASTTTPAATVQYIKINADGTLASSWTTNATSFTTARAAYGGNIATIWGGYMYVNGGCSAVTTGDCSTIISSGTTQLASINADGSVSDWTSLTGVTQTLVGQGLVAWRNTLYTVGGCGATTSSSNCTTALTTTSFGHIKTDGDVSPKSTETSLPTIGSSAGQVGGISAAVVVNDGFIYNIGGCSVNGCTTMSPNGAFASIASDGSIGAWTAANSIINSTTGLGASGVTVYNNYIYMVGGTNGVNGTTSWKRSIFRSLIDPTTHAPGVFTEQTGLLPAIVAGDNYGNDTGTQITNADGYGMSAVFARSSAGSSGSLYVIGGCYSSSAGIGCGTMWYTKTLRCTISHVDGSVSSCVTTNQLQLQDMNLSTAAGRNQGLGAGEAAVWGDYIYIAGGVCGLLTTTGATAEANGCDGVSTSTTTNTSEISKVYFAKFNSSGDIVRADNGTASGGWQIASNKMPIPNRRGVAFAVNGYLYIAGGHDGTTTSGAGTLSTIVYAKINPATGDLGVFASVSQGGSTNNIITARWGHGYVAANGYLYFIGGCSVGAPSGSCTTITTTDESVQVYNNYSGSPKAYNTTGLFTTDRYGASAAASGGFLYVAGGCSTTTDCTTYLGDSAYAQLAPDGTISSWTTGPSFPSSALRAHGCMVAQGGYLYYMGGRDSTTAAYSTVYYSQLSSGVPGAWATATKGIGDTGSGAQARLKPGCTTFNNKVYVTGGADATPTYQATVYATPALATGGNITTNWSSTTSFTTGRNGQVAVAYGSTLYILGGFDGTNYLIDVQYAPIDSSGNVGSWSYSTSLPKPVREGAGFAANGYIYVFGGRSAATTCTTATYVAPIIGYPPGSSTRYGIGIWSQTNITYTGARYGVAAAYSDGKAYLLGGMCNATLTGANRVVYSTLQAQPQVSKYSLMIDTDTDVFPSKWLMNGIDNGIGAQWIFNYMSSTSANNSWGINTAYGAVTLGTPATYTPLDGSGTNTNTTVGARFYYLYVTVDASQAFGYPEDVSRGPTIADLTLQFSSDPSKRLMHGRTFTGGIQQPLDTPF